MDEQGKRDRVIDNGDSHIATHISHIIHVLHKSLSLS